MQQSQGGLGAHLLPGDARPAGRYYLHPVYTLFAGVAIGAIATSILVYPHFPRSVDRVAFLAGTPPIWLPEVPPAWPPPTFLASPPLNNSCLLPALEKVEGPKTFDACRFVIESTDALWNGRGNVEKAFDAFDDNFQMATSWGTRVLGMDALKRAVYSQMRAFPDIQIHISDCQCDGNDVSGYKCSMPDILTGTNLGPSAYGPATGKWARWTGMVQSYIKRNPKDGKWRYMAEWGVHDEYSLIAQLGLDFSKVPHPSKNTEPLHDCQPLVNLEKSTFLQN